MFKFVLKSWGHLLPPPHRGIDGTPPSRGAPNDAKCHFLTIWWENLTAARVLRINMVSIRIPKIKIDPSPEGKNALVFIFWSFIKLTFFSQMGNFITKFNFVSVRDYIKVIEIYLGG